MKNRIGNKIMGPLFGLAVFVIVCGFLARYLTSSNTCRLRQTIQRRYGTEADEPDASQPSENTASSTVDSHIDETKESDESEKDANSMATNTTTTNNVQTEAEEVNNSTSDTDVISSDRVTYQDGFYYESLSDEIRARLQEYPILFPLLKLITLLFRLSMLAEGDSRL